MISYRFTLHARWSSGYTLPCRLLINLVTNPFFVHPHSIVFFFEEIVSMFAQRPRDETFAFIANNILFASEFVSWFAMIFVKEAGYF